jgi:hypothetical protein
MKARFDSQGCHLVVFGGTIGINFGIADANELSPNGFRTVIEAAAKAVRQALSAAKS